MSSASPGQGPLPAVSVVVATRDRPASLERCLTALSWQTAKRLEVVVVDDASARAGVIRSVVERAVEASNGGHRDALVARIVEGDGRGPAAARNLGARAARGGVVCFTDDDCVPEPRWAECLAAACAGGGAAAGITITDPVAGRAATAAQVIAHTLQAASLVGDRLGFAPTCNLACIGEVVRALPFDESFPLAAGEDRDWCARLVAAGLPLRFVPEAVVEHRPRTGLVGLLRQQSRTGAAPCATGRRAVGAGSPGPPSTVASRARPHRRDLPSPRSSSSRRWRSLRGPRWRPRGADASPAAWPRAGAYGAAGSSSGSPASPSCATPQAAAIVHTTSACRGAAPSAASGGRRDDRPCVARRVGARAPHALTTASAEPQDADQRRAG